MIDFSGSKNREKIRPKTGVFGHPSIRYWKEKYDGKVIPLRINLKGHAAAYKTRFIRSKEEDLDTTYSLEDITKMLGVEKFLP